MVEIPDQLAWDGDGDRDEDDRGDRGQAKRSKSSALGTHQDHIELVCRDLVACIDFKMMMMTPAVPCYARRLSAPPDGKENQLDRRITERKSCYSSADFDSSIARAPSEGGMSRMASTLVRGSRVLSSAAFSVTNSVDASISTNLARRFDAFVDQSSPTWSGSRVQSALCASTSSGFSSQSYGSRAAGMQPDHAPLSTEERVRLSDVAHGSTSPCTIPRRSVCLPQLARFEQMVRSPPQSLEIPESLWRDVSRDKYQKSFGKAIGGAIHSFAASIGDTRGYRAGHVSSTPPVHSSL